MAARLAPASLITLLAGICHNPRPPVTEIEVVPSAVVLGDLSVPISFELEARLFTGAATDRRSLVEAQGYYDPDWKVSETWLALQPLPGFKARATVVSAPTVPALVTVKAGGKTSLEARISVAPSALTGQDIVNTAYTPQKPPDAAVVNGSLNATGDPCHVALSAFVKRGTLGQIFKPCGNDPTGWAAVLAVGHRLLIAPVPWTAPPATNTVNAGAIQSQLRSLPVALRVMVWHPDSSPAGLVQLRQHVVNTAKADIQAANPILADARSGIQVALDPANILVTVQNSEVAVLDCRPGHDQTLATDVPGLLTVYYVDKLTGRKATTCARHEGRPQEFIYIDRYARSTSTFVHELGHALGLTLPHAGHTESFRGFDVTNVMWGEDNDEDPLGRKRLSVGQVFRMNADSASWLNWAVVASGSPVLVRESTAPRLGCQCGEDDQTGPCPRQVDDVARASARQGEPGDWHCFDLLQLKKLPMAEADAKSPVAILAGRSWRSPPGPTGCKGDIPGRMSKHSTATFVKFENLTRVGSCPSWATIFFKTLGLLHLKLQEPTFVWTQVANELFVWDDMVEPITVMVDVRFADDHKDEFALDKAHALETFGESNRSGILLDFQETNTGTTTPTCPTSTALRQIRLCYAPNGNIEGQVLAPGVVKVFVGQRSETTASHFLGQALKLQALTTNELAAHPREYTDNIMRPLPANRGKKLTLGQVYRINVPLINDESKLPSCSGPAGCPSLWADVNQ
jgi:hypothetical protein